MKGKKTSSIGVILPAAGSGSRFGELKQFKTLGSKPLLFHTLLPFLTMETVSEIVLVVNENRVEDYAAKLIDDNRFIKCTVVSGGERRQDSVQNGLNALSPKCDVICIHDVARPFVTQSLIQSCIDACNENDGAVAAIRATDTLKEVQPGQTGIQQTVDRERIWRAQTPQVFKRSVLHHALSHAIENQLTGTDESALAESLGYSIHVVEGSTMNRKITTREDWVLAEAIFHQKLGDENGG